MLYVFHPELNCLISSPFITFMITRLKKAFIAALNKEMIVLGKITFTKHCQRIVLYNKFVKVVISLQTMEFYSCESTLEVFMSV